ncbi:MAG: hypothetical protein ACQRW7_11475 [Caulobacterales bacterium]|uniref:hypothetical protein n=1 Tax=Glycocaulis sp. TaxID=1969725 RepID=UPI003FA0FFF3
MSATILPFRPARPSTTTGAPVRLADRLLEAALALRIAARRQRPAPEPRRLEIGEKVLFQWPSGEQNRMRLPSPQQAGKTSGRNDAGAGREKLNLAVGVITSWLSYGPREEDRCYFIQLTEGPDRGTRICHPRKGLITVFPQGGDA